MAYVKKLYKENFLEYASYVIKDRAIPELIDGMKPVQRRILHSLFEMDDGKFHKVANVVGHCMKYHPHGDASIYSALVVLANKELFIDKQGNFGNILTGDEASAARYIECRIRPFAKRILFNPELTEWTESYDGRNNEPVAFPAKLPLVIIQGAEGIAVGMATKILPHNIVEVIDAVSAVLKKKSFQLFPDFPTGGHMDVSEYKDGLGKVSVRAKMDLSDPKKVIIQEVPYGVTTESLITSIESAAKRKKVKIKKINDFTTEDVNIEVVPENGVSVTDLADALYAFTDCEASISVNLLVIRDGLPAVMTVTEVIQHHATQLVDVLTRELENELQHLLDRLHARTLERIFIEEGIYKRIEKEKTRDGVVATVYKGFEPFAAELLRPLDDEDIERLLKIPIRRISLYDIEKAKKEIEEINARIEEIRKHLANIVKYALGFLTNLRKDVATEFVRKTEMGSFDKIEARQVAIRDLSVKYDKSTGYLGYNVKSSNAVELYKASQYDRILIVRSDGTYYVTDLPDVLFVDKSLALSCIADKDILANHVLTILYLNKENGCMYIKRCAISQYILNKEYNLVPPEGKLVKVSAQENLAIVLKYKKTPGMRKTEERFTSDKYLVKGVKAGGVRLSNKIVQSMKISVIRTAPKGKGKS